VAYPPPNDHTAAGRRDGAIIALAYGAGLRRAEIAGLQVAAIQDDDGETITIKVVGKRNKERLVYLDNGGAQHMRAWLQTRGTEPGALFYSGRRGGHLGKDGMTPQSVMVVVLKRAAEGGVSDVSPHDMRRSFVSDLLDSGVDIATVAAMAGHASIQTTARYDRRGETAKKRAARSLHVPFYGTAM
jgi:site-specific recombinase XerD